MLDLQPVEPPPALGGGPRAPARRSRREPGSGGSAAPAPARPPRSAPGAPGRTRGASPAGRSGGRLLGPPPPAAGSSPRATRSGPGRALPRRRPAAQPPAGASPPDRQTASSASRDAPPAKTPRRAEHRLLAGVQQVVAPGDGVPQRLVPGRQVAGATAQERQPALQPPQQGARRQHGDARGGQLQGQGQAVQPAADRGAPAPAFSGVSAKPGRAARARATKRRTARTAPGRPRPSARRPVRPAAAPAPGGRGQRSGRHGEPVLAAARSAARLVTSALRPGTAASRSASCAAAGSTCSKLSSTSSSTARAGAAAGARAAAGSPRSTSPSARPMEGRRAPGSSSAARGTNHTPPGNARPRRLRAPPEAGGHRQRQAGLADPRRAHQGQEPDVRPAHPPGHGRDLAPPADQRRARLRRAGVGGRLSGSTHPAPPYPQPAPDAK